MSSTGSKIDLRADSLIPVIKEALSMGCDPHHYHPIYIQIYEMTYLHGKYGNFSSLTDKEEKLWNSCYANIEAEKARLNESTPELTSCAPSPIASTTHASKVKEENNDSNLDPVSSALNKLIKDIRRKIYSVSPDTIMSKYIHAKKYFLSHCALVTTEQDHEKMKSFWERLTAPLTDEDGSGPVLELQNLDQNKGKCFICKEHNEHLKRHIRNMHALTKKICQLCGKSFPNPCSLYYHKRDNHKRFVLKHKLTDSLRKHRKQ